MALKSVLSFHFEYVGGPAVNTVTKEVLAGSAVDFNTETKVVKEVVAGKKIRVKMYSDAWPISVGGALNIVAKLTPWSGPKIK